MALPGGVATSTSPVSLISSFGVNGWPCLWMAASGMDAGGTVERREVTGHTGNGRLRGTWQGIVPRRAHYGQAAGGWFASGNILSKRRVLSRKE